MPSIAQSPRSLLHPSSMLGVVKGGYVLIQALQCNPFKAKTADWSQGKLIKGNKCSTNRNRSLSAAAEEDNKSDGNMIMGAKYLFWFVG